MTAMDTETEERIIATKKTEFHNGDSNEEEFEDEIYNEKRINEILKSEFVIQTVQRMMKEKLTQIETITCADLMSKLRKVEDENRNLRKREKVLETRISQLESSKKPRLDDNPREYLPSESISIPKEIMEEAVTRPRQTLLSKPFETLSIPPVVMTATYDMMMTDPTGTSTTQSKLVAMPTAQVVSSGEANDFIPGLFRSVPTMQVKPYKKNDIATNAIRNDGMNISPEKHVRTNGQITSKDSLLGQHLNQSELLNSSELQSKQSKQQQQQHQQHHQQQQQQQQPPPQPPLPPPLLLQHPQQLQQNQGHRHPSPANNGILIPVSSGREQFMQQHPQQRHQLIRHQVRYNVPQNVNMFEYQQQNQLVHHRLNSPNINTYGGGPLSPQQAMDLSIKQQQMRFHSLSPRQMQLENQKMEQMRIHHMQQQEEFLRQQEQMQRMQIVDRENNQQRQINNKINEAELPEKKKRGPKPKDPKPKNFPKPILIAQQQPPQPPPPMENGRPILLTQQYQQMPQRHIVEVPESEVQRFRHQNPNVQLLTPVSSQYQNVSLPPKPPPPAYDESLQLPKVHATITSDTSNILLKWDCKDASKRFQDNVQVYLLFAFHTTDLRVEPPKELYQWKKIGEIGALPLPIACSLTRSFDGHNYFFSVVPVDQTGRIGHMSNSCALKVTL